MGRIPERIVEEVAYRTDIVELIGSRITLKRAGSTYKALCPFHKEKTPSFVVSPQRQTYHCFGCSAHGNVFGFLMERDGMDFVSAVRMLAEQAGIEIEEEQDDGQSRTRKTLYELHSKVAAKYHSTLRKSNRASHARAYLEERGLTNDTVRAFMIGYAPDSWDAVLNWGRKAYSLDLLVEAGIVVQRHREEQETRYYDRFRDRLMFPVFDGQGRVVAFSGRILQKDARAAKYVNSPETPIFQKSRVLYGFDKARRRIASSREALICEGQIDVIRCHQAGFDSAVAAQGTAFTDDHVAMVKRFADSVVLAFDGDGAGQDAAIKTARLFIAAGLAVRIARMPADEDPDTVIREKGTQAFAELIDHAGSAIAFHVARLSAREDLGQEVGLMRATNAVLETIVRTPNPIQQSRQLSEASDCLHVPVSALEERMQQIATKVHDADRRRERRRREQPAAAAAPPPGPATAPRQAGTPIAAGPGQTPPLDEYLLCAELVHAVDHPELADLIEAYLPLDMVTDPMCRATAQVAIEGVRTNSAIDDLVEELNTPEFPILEFVMELQRRPSRVTGAEFKREDVVQSLILAMWRCRLAAERDALGPDKTERRVQLTYDLKSLQRWQDGAPIIEVELEAADSPSEDTNDAPGHDES